MKTERQLVLYIRNGCHLCEEMLMRLKDLQRQWDFTLAVVDVDVDEGLRRRFGEKLPVLSSGDFEICHHWVNETALLAYLNKG